MSPSDHKINHLASTWKDILIKCTNIVIGGAHTLIDKTKIILGKSAQSTGKIKLHTYVCNEMILKVHKREKFFGSDFEFFTIL